VQPEEFEATCARLCSELTSDDVVGEPDAEAPQQGAEAVPAPTPAGYGAQAAERGGKAAYAAQAVA
jgi:hypothetical protein